MCDTPWYLEIRQVTVPTNSVPLSVYALLLKYENVSRGVH